MQAARYHAATGNLELATTKTGTLGATVCIVNRGAIIAIDDTPPVMSNDSQPSISLNLAEQEQRIAKLKAEQRLVERQQRTEVLKSLGPSFAAIVAVVGVMVSTSQWYYGNKATRQAQREERLERHLEQLGSTEVTRRITAIASLKSVLSGKDNVAAEQAIAALTGLLAVEPSSAAQNANVSALSGISGPAAAGRRAMILQELADISRGLVAEGKLWHLENQGRAHEPEPSSADARAISVSHAIAALLRQGARLTNLSGIYLSNENLIGLDLSATNFKHAVLTGTSFDRAILNRSVFDGSILVATSFRHSLLRLASFRQSIGTVDSRNYVLDQVYPIQQSPIFVAVIGPVFDEADLNGASFDGHWLFPMFSDEMHQRVAPSGFSFKNAKLEGVDLRRAWAFGPRVRGLARGCDEYWNDLPADRSLVSFGGSPFELLAAQVFSEPSVLEHAVQCRRSLELIGAAFWGSRRTEALSPAFLDSAIRQQEARRRRAEPLN